MAFLDTVCKKCILIRGSIKKKLMYPAGINKNKSDNGLRAAISSLQNEPKREAWNKKSIPTNNIHARTVEVQNLF